MFPPPSNLPLMSPASKNLKSWLTMTMDASPRISSTLKKYPMKPLAYSTDFLASFASFTVKNRIRI